MTDKDEEIKSHEKIPEPVIKRRKIRITEDFDVDVREHTRSYPRRRTTTSTETPSIPSSPPSPEVPPRRAKFLARIFNRTKRPPTEEEKETSDAKKEIEEVNKETELEKWRALRRFGQEPLGVRERAVALARPHRR